MNHELLAQFEQQRDAHLHMAQSYAHQALAIHQRNLPRLQEELAQMLRDGGTNAQRLALVAKIAEMEMFITDERDLLGELGKEGALQVIGQANTALATLEDYRDALTSWGTWNVPERERQVERVRADIWQRRIMRVREVLKDAQRRLK